MVIVAVVIVGAFVARDHVATSLDRSDAPCPLAAPRLDAPLARRNVRVEVHGPVLEEPPVGTFCMSELPPDAYGYVHIGFIDGRQWIDGPFDVARDGTYEAYVDIPEWAPDGRAFVVFGSGSFEGKLGRTGSPDSWSPGTEIRIGS